MPGWQSSAQAERVLCQKSPSSSPPTASEPMLCVSREPKGAEAGSGAGASLVPIRWHQMLQTKPTWKSQTSPRRSSLSILWTCEQMEKNKKTKRGKENK